MNQFLNFLSESPAGAIDRRSTRTARWAGIAVVAASSLGCAETSPSSTSDPNGGSGGQVSAGTGGAGVVAGASGTPTGGTPTGTSGSSAMAGTGGSGGASSAGSGTGGGGAGASGGGAGGAAGAGGSGGTSEDGWVPLFNGKNLDGFTPAPGQEGLFAVDMAAGESAIHVYPTQADQSNQAQATLRTNESYGSYVFHEEYKWGTKRFADRKDKDRDNGLCFHICNDVTQVWPESIEFQLGSQAWPGDWVSGNIFMLVNKTRAQWSFVTMNNQEVYSATGTKKMIGAPASYYKALAPSPNLNKGGAGSAASPATEWNTIELTVHGSKDASYNVNGTVVNGLTDMECQVGGTWMPLDHGPLALQAEFAEVYFRNIKIKVLTP